ncbi:hypothetical protein CES85_3452 (plasmid) [Ochrobactrum quorumnocens]|uniref:Uncharacterized protein n=1 Tax=Ochrobactrum quorumnocens TaxID=271865 RepID=A0A248UNH4_9HYPH|nr:hypothetical protein CES85_3452 [[Ochrobactrum] quorumnocens]
MSGRKFRYLRHKTSAAHPAVDDTLGMQLRKDESAFPGPSALSTINCRIDR